MNAVDRGIDAGGFNSRGHHGVSGFSRTRPAASASFPNSRRVSIGTSPVSAKAGHSGTSPGGHTPVTPYWYNVNEYNVSPAATRMCWRPSTM